jgi:integrase
MLRRRCQVAGLRMLNPHSFRHGLAMLMLNERGADMSLVQKVLGHSQISTTARHYAEWLTEGIQREFADKMRGVGQ